MTTTLDLEELKRLRNVMEEYAPGEAQWKVLDPLFRGVETCVAKQAERIKELERELEEARKDSETALRDKFAMAAIGAVTAIPDSEWPWDFSGNLKDELGNNSMGYSDNVAFGAYSIADAMIAARQQKD